MNLSRRGLLAASPVAALAVATAAAADTTDLALSCDTAAAPAVKRAAAAYTARTGVRIRIFPTAPGLLLPQLEREIQNDVLVTSTATLDAADKAGLAKGSRSAAWRNRLVIARASGGPPGSFAVPDPSPASDIDGPAVLRALGLAPAAVQGVLDTDAVAWLLAHAAAAEGLVHQTELVADPRLAAGAPVPDSAWPPITYAATVSKLSSRGDPAAFIAFLGSPDGIAALRAAGLEPVT